MSSTTTPAPSLLEAFEKACDEFNLPCIGHTAKRQRASAVVSAAAALNATEGFVRSEWLTKTELFTISNAQSYLS